MTKSVSQSTTRRPRLCLWAHARLMRANVAANIGDKSEAARLRASLADFVFANSVPLLRRVDLHLGLECQPIGWIPGTFK